MKYNIFQGNDQLNRIVAKVLGYEEPEFSWFTEDMYFETFFYLSKRFGPPRILDDYKDGGTWDFKVKQYQIRVCLNSSWVSFIVFGDYKFSHHFTHSSYWVKMRREERRKKDLLIVHLEDPEKRSAYEREKIQQLLDEFQKEKNIPDDISPEEFNEKYGGEFWFDWINKFNNQILNVDFDYYKQFEYSNASTRHALKTLEQFIHNMLTPIWVRDVSFNIKGRCGTEYEKYSGNIPIEFEQPTDTVNHE